VSRHRLVGRGKLRIWLAVNGVILAAMTGWILRPAVIGANPQAVMPTVVPQPSAKPPPPPARPTVTKATVLSRPGVRFGLCLPQAPWEPDELDRVAAKAGARPSLLQFFARWDQEFRAEWVRASYAQGAVPVISWEPWAGAKRGESQPAYALSKIIRGDFDAYVRRFAAGVRDQNWPVAIRLAHEMNGHWYPWSERRSGNRSGEYVRAWRHVHDIFLEIGANNVIWIWSPNILRPVPDVSLRALYPGDAYVDWIGMVGYAVRERTAGAVFDPTLTELRFTHKRVVITETGAQPGARKVGWIRDFFRWLPKHPDVIGFIWFEYSVDQGANQDWRFSADPDAAAAFRRGVTSIRLAPTPAASAPAPSSSPTP
jgi:hypothetical protein